MSPVVHPSPAEHLTTRAERRHDVDALRVILFGLLIWLHYVTLCTWTQEPTPVYENRTAMTVISVMHQWRLAALFVISGIGTAFAFRRRTWQAYLNERLVRLLVPLLFATYVLLGGFVDPVETASRFFEVFPGIGRMPYGHLWFIYNLLIYSVVLIPLFAYVRRNPDGRLMNGLRALLSMPFGVGLILVPPLLYGLSNVFFKPWVAGEVGMWWEFPRYFLYFAVGFLLISAREEYFAALERTRYSLVALTVVMTIVYLGSQSIFGVPDLAIGGWVKQGHPAFSTRATVGIFALELHAWVSCLFIFSWAAKLLNRPNRIFAYLNQSVYCSYIVHISMAIMAAAIVFRFRLGYASGLMLGLVIQTLFCLALFEVAKRSRLGRILFGIKSPIAAKETTVAWQQRFASMLSAVVLCCLILAMITLGWQLGKKHFIVPSTSKRQPADAMTSRRQEALLAVGDQRPAISHSDWPMYNHRVKGWRFNHGEQTLTQENAGSLELKWRFPSAASGIQIGVVHATPSVVNSHVYFGTATEPAFYKLKPDGSIAWVYRIDSRTTDANALPAGGPNLINGENGVMTSALVTDDAVYFGNSVGVLFSLDRITGEEPQRFPEPIELTDDYGTHRYTHGPSTSLVWSTPSYDEATGTIFFGTDVNNSPRIPTDDNPRIDSEVSAAVIAVDVKTGNKKWVCQLHKGDVFNHTMAGYDSKTDTYKDCSVGDTQKVYSIQVGDDQKAVVGGGCKNGCFHVIDASVGEIIAKTPMREGKPSYPLGPDPRMIALPSVMGGIQTGCAFNGESIFTNGIDWATLNTRSPLSPEGGRVVSLDADLVGERWRHERPRIDVPGYTGGDPVGAGVALRGGIAAFTTTITEQLVVLDAASGKTLNEINVGTV